MSKDGSANIPHTAVTDHRILRIPEPNQSKPNRPDPGRLPIRNYHDGAPGFDRAEADRDLGVALCDFVLQCPASSAQLSMVAEPLLRQVTGAIILTTSRHGFRWEPYWIDSAEAPRRWRHSRTAWS